MANSSPKIHIQVRVSLSNYTFIPGDEGFCPIAECLKDDQDVLAARVNDQVIFFSRRSTGQRYTYKTPPTAVHFIHAVDAIVETKQVPADFTLILTDFDLIKIKDRAHGRLSINDANDRGDIVRVNGNGEVEVVNPKSPAVPREHRPARKINVA